jgi:tRNA 2-selenouridine synthase
MPKGPSEREALSISGREYLRGMESTKSRGPGGWLFEAVLLDARSPGEFGAGAVPGAVSFPLFDDEERAEVGTLYKQSGQERAVERGLEVVGPKLAGFVERARVLREEGRELGVYCARGGMRSGAVAWLLETAGLPVVKLEGGYKAYRRWVVRELAEGPWELQVVGGMTGTGKTEVVHALAERGAATLDLEGLARHLGSAFGNLGRAVQPTSEAFGNACHRVLHGFAPGERVWVEDESRRIGSVHLPEELHARMRCAPMWELERTDDERIAHLIEVYGDAAPESLAAAFERIRAKLGGADTARAVAGVQEGDYAAAAAIGLRYYDKLYRHTQARAARPAVHPVDARGKTADAVAALLLGGG